MTQEQFSHVKLNSPILCADGSFGLFIRFWGLTIGVQVPGEEHIRNISIEHVHEVGDGALIEREPLETSE
mgnify:CR=1 FL=1